MRNVMLIPLCVVLASSVIGHYSMVAGDSSSPAWCYTDGTGAVNQVPRWTDTCQIGVSEIFQTNGAIGIGRSDPQQFVDVQGGFRANSVSTGYLDFQTHTGTIEYLRVTENVGVGNVSNPSARMEIDGNCKATKFLETSDSRYKRHLNTIPLALQSISTLRPVTYEGDASMEYDQGPTMSFGLIAQEVEGVVPEVVATDAAGLKSIAYTRLIPILIEALREQQNQIMKLRATLGR